MLSGLFVGWIAGNLVGLFAGILIGLLVGLFAWALTEVYPKIEPVEALLLSRDGLPYGLVIGLVSGLISVLAGQLVVGLFFGLFLGKIFESGRHLTKHSMLSPNEGIRRSGKNALFVGLDVGSRHFFLPESPSSLVSCLLKRLTPLPGSHFWARC